MNSKHEQSRRLTQEMAFQQARLTLQRLGLGRLTAREQRRLRHPSRVVRRMWEQLSPLTIRLANDGQHRLRWQGQPLTPSQCQLAKAMGVQHPRRIRLVWSQTPRLPYRLPLRKLLHRHGLQQDNLWGYTLGYGVTLHPDAQGDPALLAHELIHVAQYERHGMRGFTQSYLLGLLLLGYHHHPMEREAEQAVWTLDHLLGPSPGMFDRTCYDSPKKCCADHTS